MRWVALILVIVIIFNVGGTLDRFLDLISHISRYRSYLRKYPSMRYERGRVWKHTK